MRKRALLAVLGVLAPSGWGGTEAASASFLGAYCHPGARLLAGIEWGRVAPSAAGRWFRQRLVEAGSGLEWLDSVERVVVSSPGRGSPNMERPPLLVTAEGRFDLGRLKIVAMRKLSRIQRYHGIEVLEETPGSGPPLSLALVSSELILLGDAGAVRSALDSFPPNGPCETSPLAARAQEMAAANDVWLMADLSPGMLPSQHTEAAALLAGVQRAEAGLALQNGLDLEAALETGSPGEAEKLAGRLQLLLALKMAGRNGPDPTRNLQVFTEGPLVKMALRISEEEVQTLLREAESALLAAIAPETRRSSPEARQPQPRPRLIRIYGLAEGVREIPLGR